MQWPGLPGPRRRQCWAGGGGENKSGGDAVPRGNYGGGHCGLGEEDEQRLLCPLKEEYGFRQVTPHFE